MGFHVKNTKKIQNILTQGPGEAANFAVTDGLERVLCVYYNIVLSRRHRCSCDLLLKVLGTHSGRKSGQRVAVPQFPYSNPIEGYSPFFVWMPSSSADCSFHPEGFPVQLLGDNKGD